jgi:hypothetical protein
MCLQQCSSLSFATRISKNIDRCINWQKKSRKEAEQMQDRSILLTPPEARIDQDVSQSCEASR